MSMMPNVERLQQVIQRISNRSYRFDMWEPSFCVYGHARKLFGGRLTGSPTYYLAATFNIPPKQANNIYHSVDWTREDAILELNAIVEQARSTPAA